jgi:hypothetical protein
MAYRTPHAPSEASADKPEFTFHLLHKKSAKGLSASIGGAIVAGPVAALFSDALGAALGEAEDVVHPKHPPAKPVSDSQKFSGKPKSKRRRPSRIARRP